MCNCFGFISTKSCGLQEIILLNISVGIHLNRHILNLFLTIFCTGYNCLLGSLAIVVQSPILTDS